MLGLASCGSGSSKEAKELLSKMLQFVGIPQTIVANICQDANRDGTCGVGELFTKVTINKGDSIDDIWRKISLTKDGRYFLQTYNPELPILVELQDVAKINYDDGKFTLAFNGFKTKKDDNETKEVSILESMVDANALSKTIADKFRTLTNKEAQDKYYTALLDSLETNINTLRTNELNKTTAISATIKEMADETRANQEIANRINTCGNDQACIDNEIKKIKDELIITDEEATKIKSTQETNSTTPEATPTALSGAEEVYGKWVKPSQSVCENGGGNYNQYGLNECRTNWKNAQNICSATGGSLPTKEVLGAVVTNCGGDFVDEPWNDWESRTNKNIENESYQACYKERGFTYYYWSSTTVASDSSYAWIVFFDNGFDNWGSKTDSVSVRCIR